MRRGRAVLEVALVHGLLGWLYVAVWAVLHPERLAAPVVSWLPVRRDTFGAACFAASALACFLLRLDRLPRGPGRVLDAALFTLVGHPLLAWAYLCANSLSHPWTIDQRLTHFAPYPTEGTAAAAGFLCSALALLALRARRPRQGADHG